MFTPQNHYYIRTVGEPMGLWTIVYGPTEVMAVANMAGCYFAEVGLPINRPSATVARYMPFDGTGRQFEVTVI